MIKHIVMYKLKNSTAENCKAMVDKFMSMQGKIEVLKSVQAGSDILKSARSFDVCLECVFEKNGGYANISIASRTYSCKGVCR